MGYLDIYESRPSETSIVISAHATEMANKVYHDTVLYHKGTNIIDVANLVDPSMMSVGKVFKVKH